MLSVLRPQHHQGHQHLRQQQLVWPNYKALVSYSAGRRACQLLCPILKCQWLEKHKGWKQTDSHCQEPCTIWGFMGWQIWQWLRQWQNYGSVKHFKFSGSQTCFSSSGVQWHRMHRKHEYQNLCEEQMRDWGMFRRRLLYWSEALFGMPLHASTSSVLLQNSIIQPGREISSQDQCQTSGLYYEEKPATYQFPFNSWQAWSGVCVRWTIQEARTCFCVLKLAGVKHLAFGLPFGKASCRSKLCMGSPISRKYNASSPKLSHIPMQYWDILSRNLPYTNRTT